MCIQKRGSGGRGTGWNGAWGVPWEELPATYGRATVGSLRSLHIVKLQKDLGYWLATKLSSHTQKKVLLILKQSRRTSISLVSVFIPSPGLGELVTISLGFLVLTVQWSCIGRIGDIRLFPDFSLE